MATQTRIYLVRHNATDELRLVRAAHPANAVKHVAEGAYSVCVASQEDLVNLLTLGQRVESIGAEQAPLPTERLCDQGPKD